MGVFGVSSKSRSSSDSSRQTGQAGDNSIVNVTNVKGKNSKVLGAGATLNTFGKGASVTIAQTDNGALALAQDAIQRAQASIENVVKGQADSTAAALGSLGRLGETRVTGGENLQGENDSKLYIALAILAAIVLGLGIWKR